MKSVMAIGSRVFVRQLILGGAVGRVVKPEEVADTLRSALSESEVGLILLEAAHVEKLPGDLYKEAFSSHDPEVVALGSRSNDVLRKRIRQTLGADLLVEKPTA